MRQITHCLNPTLKRVCMHAIELESLTRMVQDYLQQEPGAYRVSSFTKGCLVLSVSPIWAPELRYRLPELRDYLRREAGLYQLITIKMIVAPEQTETHLKPKQRPSSALSRQARLHIQASSELCAYAPLKAALNRLSRADKSAI